MGKKDLYQILKKNDERNFMLFKDGSIFWTDKVFLVKDDPNLKMYLRKYVESNPKRKLNPNKIYCLDAFKGEIEFIGYEVFTPIRIGIERILNADVDKRLDLGPRMSLEINDTRSTALFIKDSENAIFIDSDYLNYLEKIRALVDMDIFLGWNGMVYFGSPQHIEAVVAPLFTAARINIQYKKIMEVL